MAEEGGMADKIGTRFERNGMDNAIQAGERQVWGRVRGALTKRRNKESKRPIPGDTSSLQEDKALHQNHQVTWIPRTNERATAEQ